MTLNLRIFIVLAALIAGIVLAAGSVFAQGNSGSTKPGWGYGDQNHIHTGPPGQSVRPGNSTSVSVISVVNTGGNTVQGNNGPVNIVTGAATSVINVFVSTGSSVINFFTGS